MFYYFFNGGDNGEQSLNLSCLHNSLYFLMTVMGVHNNLRTVVFRVFILSFRFIFDWRLRWRTKIKKLECCTYFSFNRLLCFNDDTQTENASPVLSFSLNRNVRVFPFGNWMFQKRFARYRITSWLLFQWCVFQRYKTANTSTK